MDIYQFHAYAMIPDHFIHIHQFMHIQRFWSISCIFINFMHIHQFLSNSCIFINLMHMQRFLPISCIFIASCRFLSISCMFIASCQFHAYSTIPVHFTHIHFFLSIHACSLLPSNFHARYGSHFDFYSFERHYGMLRGQINVYLPPGHPIIVIRNNRNQNGRCIGKKVYCVSGLNFHLFNHKYAKLIMYRFFLTSHSEKWKMTRTKEE